MGITDSSMCNGLIFSAISKTFQRLIVFTRYQSSNNESKKDCQMPIEWVFHENSNGVAGI
jgi:hypothetical protein